MLDISPEITNIYGRDFVMLDQDDQERLVDLAFSYWRSKGFPYPPVHRKIAVRELALLKEITAYESERIFRRSSTVGLRTANGCQPKLWEARVKGRSPLQCFEDDESLRAILRKAAKLRPDRRCWSANEVRTFCGLFNRSRVSNFRPTVAKIIYEMYSSKGDPVLDFSAGYGGRAFGALACDRLYYGVDPEGAHISGIHKMAKMVGGKVKLLNDCAEDVLCNFPASSFSLVFSSPPYFSLEKYSDDGRQSYIRYPGYEMWLRYFLKKIILRSFEILEKGGFFIVNIANISKFDLANDFSNMATEVFGDRVALHSMFVRSNPSYTYKYGVTSRVEPIFVFRK